MLQHLPDKSADLARHRDLQRADRTVHQVRIKPDSLLAQIVGKAPLGVNSTHHQAVDKVAEGFLVSADTEEGIVEAVESANAKFVLGVQWHPERLIEDSRSQKLFQGIVECVRHHH